MHPFFAMLILVFIVCWCIFGAHLKDQIEFTKEKFKEKPFVYIFIALVSGPIVWGYWLVYSICYIGNYLVCVISKMAD
jgi:hypothetical protein